MAGLESLPLPFPLAADGGKPCGYAVRDGALILTGAAGTNLFADPSGEGTPPDAGWVAGPAPAGDFAFAARVTVEFSAVYDAGVLLLHAGPRHWAKLCFEYSPQRRPTIVTVVTRGTSDDANAFEVDGGTSGLRISRAGRAWAFHASPDGTRWRLVRYFSLGDPDAGDQVKVGFMAQSPTGTGCTAVFDDIWFSPAAPADLRDGS